MSNKTYIWNYFKNKLGNEYGVSGLMGNLVAESNLNPMNLQNSYETSLGFTDETYTNAVNNGSYSKDSFVYDEAGFGLAQWTYWSRKKLLYEYFKNGGYTSIGGVDLACDFLYWELQNSYSGVLSVLKNATSIREASDKVLHDFENPAVQDTSVEEYRCRLGQSIYNELTGTSGNEGTGGDSGGNTGTVTKKKAMSLLLMYIASRGK